MRVFEDAIDDEVDDEEDNVAEDEEEGSSEEDEEDQPEQETSARKHSREGHPSHSSQSTPARAGRPTSATSFRFPNAMAGPSNPTPSPPMPVSPFRSPGSVSVKEAIAKYDGPSPQKPVAPSWKATAKGKEREDPIPVAGPSRSRRDIELPPSVGTVEGAKKVNNFLTAMEDDRDTSRSSTREVEETAAQRRIRELEERVKALESEVRGTNKLAADFISNSCLSLRVVRLLRT